MKYQDNYFNKRYGKDNYNDVDDKLGILLGSNGIARTVRYVVPKVEIQIIKLENWCRKWAAKIDEFKIKKYFGDCDKLYQFQNAVGDIQYLISSNENDDGLYHFMEFKGCVSEDSPKEIFEIYEDLSKRRTNSLNKLNEYYKDLNNELLRLKKEKQKAIEEDNKGISHVAKFENIEMKNSEVTSGFIYLMNHKMMEGLYKVGVTVRNPDICAQELSLKYNLPGSFKVVFFMKMNCPYLVEQRVLEKLNQKIVADEFVKEEIDIIKELIVSESERIISNIFEKD